MPSITKPRAAWTLAITGAALFMTSLDNLVVGVALPSIRPTSAARSSRWSGPSTPTRSPSPSC